MRHLLLACLVLVASSALAQDKERLSATDLSARTFLAFKTTDAAVQKMLPAGFVIDAPTDGPNSGANFTIVLIDYLTVQDPDGKPLPPRSTIAMTIPARNAASGEAVGVVFGGLIDQSGVPGAYGNFGAAKISVDRRSHTGADNKSVIDETWEAKADDGSVLEVTLGFVRGVPTRSKTEAKLHSSVTPKLYRIYRFEQAADVARSIPAGIDRAMKFSVKATDPRFAPLFNGSEQLISITSVPFYARSIYVPAL
jgi:hypothetical protein